MQQLKPTISASNYYQPGLWSRIVGKVVIETQGPSDAEVLKTHQGEQGR